MKAKRKYEINIRYTDGEKETYVTGGMTEEEVDTVQGKIRYVFSELEGDPVEFWTETGDYVMVDSNGISRLTFRVL